MAMALTLILGALSGAPAFADDLAKPVAPPTDEQKATDTHPAQQGKDGPAPSPSSGTPTLKPKPGPKASKVKPAANPPQ